MENISNFLTPTVIKIAIILYTVFLTPHLSLSVSKLFHHPLIQLLILLLISFVATKDITIALAMTTSLFFSFQTYNTYLLNHTKPEEPRPIHRAHSKKVVVENKHIEDDMTVDSGLSKDDEYLKKDAEDAKLVDGYNKYANDLSPGFSGKEYSSF